MAHLALLRQWQKVWPGPTFSYEYHFWRHQYYDPSNLYIARRVYEDIKRLKYMGIDGYVEDGSQRSFFPNGLAIYVYAETLLNRDADFDALVEDYFQHAYGKDWQMALSYMKAVEKAFNYPYMAGEASADPAKGKHYNPEMVPALEYAQELAALGRNLAKDHRKNPVRPQTVSWRLMEHHAEYIADYSAIMVALAKGRKSVAYEMARKFYASFGRHEYEIERYMDFNLAMRYINYMVADNGVAPLQEGN
jgi:hypothetical protein